MLSKKIKAFSKEKYLDWLNPEFIAKKTQP